MAQARRIPTPLAQHLRRIQRQLLPVVIFGGIVVLTAWLWGRHINIPNAAGEVATVQVNVASPADGRLIPLAGKPLEVFDNVKTGEVIARLDADAQLAGLDALKGELERLHKELGSVEATTKESQSSRLISQYDEARQLTMDIERLRLAILDRQSLLEQDRIEVKRLIEQVEANKGLVEKGIVPRLTLIELQLRRDVITQRIAENEKGVKEAEKQKTTCEERLKGIAQAQLADLPTVLAPIRASIAAQEARIHQLQLQIRELEVKSPIDGIVSAILCYPGQAVRIGVPIVTIAAGQSRFVVSYVRQAQRLKPAPGMSVDVALRTIPVRRIPAMVDAVGGQVEPVPPHQLVDPKLPEWGLPVRIALPVGTDLHPGELVDITFRPLPATAAAGGPVHEGGL